MSIIKLLDSFSLEGRTKEEKDNFLSRKDAFKKMGNWGKNLAMSSIPLGILSTVPRMAFAAQATVNEVLNYALALEYLEWRFYAHAVSSEDDVQYTLTDDERAVLTLIRDHEKAHVDFLTAALGDNVNLLGTGKTSLEYSDFDFRARLGGTTGVFENVYSDKGVLFALAQGFEDTGVRAYKGQAGELIVDGSEDVLTAALQIHSVEARHAAMIRRMRKMMGANTKSWITTTDYNGIGNTDQMAATAPIYAGEAQKEQLSINVPSITEASDLEVEEGWDEPLTMNAVLEIVTNFVPALQQ